MFTMIQLTHSTEYQYDEKIKIFPQYIRLHPSSHCKTPIDSFQLCIAPEEHFIHTQQDIFGNQITRVAFKQPSDFFKVTVNLQLRQIKFNPFDFLIDKHAEHYPFYYSDQMQQYLNHYITPAEDANAIEIGLAQYRPSASNTIDFCCELNKNLYQTIQYTMRDDSGVQPASVTLKTQKGSCRDTAWLLCELFRGYGLASRFVSGYLISMDDKTNTQSEAELHAWAEVFIPGAGWIGLDPTSGLLTDNQHIPLCCTPHPNEAAPIAGALQACQSTMQHTIHIKKLDNPSGDLNKNDDITWNKINTLGQAIDDVLDTQHVHLTMGAEPTYLAEDNNHAPEWQTQALGEDKSRRGWTLLQNLGHRFSPGGLKFISQGKQYPGEINPRWAYHYYWRKDGVPLWTLEIDNNKKYCLADGLHLLKTLTQALGLPEQAIHSTYVDFEYEQWRQQHSNLKQTTLPRVACYVLPLHWPLHLNNNTTHWASCEWHSLDNHVFLIPGDSAAGYRLPLNRLTKNVDPRFETCPEKSLFEQTTHLLSAEQLEKDIEKRFSSPINNNVILQHTIHTALCIECKNNQIYLFIPPLNQLEPFVDLVASIQYACRKTSIPVILNGYCPPTDNRLHHFSVTPDPGVLEINIHPSATWQELREKNYIIEAEAKKCHLTSTKTMPNGRVVASGGGNHMTLGGETPSQSPFLRRPDLLQSLIRFWQHHPSLSYLFSGLFVGPSSQAPRIDEARHDSLYEIELAFSQLSSGKNKPYWEIDRLLRYLLVDITGNRHRAEFCIDKLFCPDSENGRQGLLELRAFEMAPNPQQTLLQTLLVRALIATFWQTPYHHPLTRWETQLHDRFFLPHFLWEDFSNILAFLKKQGYLFELEWFDPFYQFRFPILGHLSCHNIKLELRIALEPWHVVDTANNSTSRTVDSSLERIQVKLNGLIPQHYHICCNGIVLPLHRTNIQGEYIAAVRFKARNDPVTLHPNIPIHLPLQFDIIDQHHQQIIASCRYDSHHFEQSDVKINDPFTKIPINTASPTLTHASIDPEFPFTLDLRKF